MTMETSRQMTAIRSRGRRAKLISLLTSIASINCSLVVAQTPATPVSSVRRVVAPSLPAEVWQGTNNPIDAETSSRQTGSQQATAPAVPLPLRNEPTPSSLQNLETSPSDLPAARLALLNNFQLTAPQTSDANTTGLTLETIEAMGLAANPSIARAAAAVAAARGAALQAGLPINPVMGYEGQQIGSNGQAEQHGFLVGQEFLRYEKRTLSREVACREVQMAEHRLAAQRARVVTDIRIAYYRALRAQRQIDLSNDLLRISEQAAKTAQALFEAKEVPRPTHSKLKLKSTLPRRLSRPHAIPTSRPGINCPQ